MRMTCALPLLLFAVASAALSAQEDGNKTDLERDKLVGAVESVSTIRLSEASKDVLKGIQFLIPLTCEVCEYDRDGNKITDGRIVNGVFNGRRTVIQLNADGMEERISTDVVPSLNNGGDPPPATVTRVLAGRLGPVDTTVSSNGKVLSHSATAYDANGFVSESWVDVGDRIHAHTVYKRTAKGEVQEMDNYGKEGLTVQETWDPETDVSRYTCFDPPGALRESWIMQNGKVLSFWEDPDQAKPCGGHTAFDHRPNGESLVYHCEHTGQCEVSRNYSSYVDAGHQNIRHTDFRNPDGSLKFAPDYQYEFDSNGNWTRRKIWLTVPGGSAPVLYADDQRAITYWEK